MSSFIWPCAVLLSSSKRASTPEWHHCSPLAPSIQRAWMTNPSLKQHTHTRTHTRMYKHMCTKSLCDIRLEAHVTHMLMRRALPVADNTALSATAVHHYRNWSHFHLHHLSSSHWWRGVAIIFSPTQSGGLRNLSPYVFLFVFPWGKKNKTPHIQKFQYCICHLTHTMKENSSARSLSSYLIQMGEVIRQSLSRLLVAGS